MRPAHMPTTVAYLGSRCHSGPCCSHAIVGSSFGTAHTRRHHLHQAAACYSKRHASVLLQRGLDCRMSGPQRQRYPPSLVRRDPPRAVRSATAGNGGTAAPASDATAGAAAAGNGDTAGSTSARGADSALKADEVDVRQILSDPDLEGDPLQFLRVTEAYWKVRNL
jgi:hypothetical protein